MAAPNEPRPSFSSKRRRSSRSSSRLSFFNTAFAGDIFFSGPSGNLFGLSRYEKHRNGRLFYPSLNVLVFAILFTSILPAAKQAGALARGAFLAVRDGDSFLFPFLQTSRQGAHRRIGEEINQRYIPLQLLPEAETNTRHEQGMSPQIEKVVIQPNALHPEGLLPNSGQQPLQRGVGRHI